MPVSLFIPCPEPPKGVDPDTWAEVNEEFDAAGIRREIQREVWRELCPAVQLAQVNAKRMVQQAVERMLAERQSNLAVA